MLTYPSDSLPQIVCPMDEDAFPPNPFCSAPPHSEPPPPLLPLFSISPSCANDGLSEHTRGGPSQGVGAQTHEEQSDTDSGATRNPSPTKRHGEDGSMVQVSESKQPEVENTQEQNEDGFDLAFTAEHQKAQKEQTSPWNEPMVFAAENEVEQVTDDTTQIPDAPKADVDSFAEGHAAENASAPKGWVIGPLFQSLKSKMASFTDIVMSPVKLFRANSPPLSAGDEEELAEWEPRADGASEDEPSHLFQPIGHGEIVNQEAEGNRQRLSDVENAKNGAVKYSRRLAFDVDLSTTQRSEEADERAITQTEKNSDSVPLKDVPEPCIVPEQVSESVASVVKLPSASLSASLESSVKMSSAAEEQRDQAVRPKPPPRKRTGTRSELKKVISDVQLWKLIKSNEAASSGSDETHLIYSSVCNTDDDVRNGESCGSVRQNIWNNLKDNGRTLNSTLDTRRPESPPEPDACSAAGPVKSKRGLKVSGHSQEVGKRKKLKGDVCTEETKTRELLNVASSDSGSSRGLRPPRKEVVLTNTVVDGDETLKPPRKRPAVSTRANRKETLPTISEAAANAQTESFPDATLVCSLVKRSSVSENNRKGSGGKTKPSGSGKRLKTKTGLPEVNVDHMDLETTVAITSSRDVQQESLSDVPVHPEQLQSSSKCKNINKKPRKRKSPVQASSTTESDVTLTVSTSSERSSEVALAHRETSPPVQREEDVKAATQPTKRLKKGCRGAVKSSESGETLETKRCVDNLRSTAKESRADEGQSSTDPVYFEMTPFGSNGQTVPSPSQTHAESHGQLNHEVTGEKEADEVFPADGGSRLRSSARRVNVKPRRTDNQRRRCVVLHSRTRKGDEMMTTNSTEDADLPSAATRSSAVDFSRRLMRSYSCPEIPSLRLHDSPWTSSSSSLHHSPQHNRTYMSHQRQSAHTPFVPHAYKSARRARRHTLSSVEVEREIAPLCLRKEVYPSRRSAPCDGAAQRHFPSLPLSPSSSLSALASCFLSSPLAFLSKKVGGRGAALSPSTLTHVSSSSSFSSSSSSSPLSSSTWLLPGFLQRSDASHAASDSGISGNPSECETQRRQRSEEEEEEDEEEDTSSSSQEFEDVGLREEKALSDSDIKVVQQHEKRGKVSSIRIRKTLPKPQNNLTPMGLPKPIRLKKKEFSLEEIYTNKNFSKPPESRLETIFEVALSRRNGSESWFGLRRVKRFVEFPEVGEVRKPKKPLVGAGKSVMMSSSRTRRGGYSRDEPSQDVDSLLCAKLDQLNLWLLHDQLIRS